MIIQGTNEPFRISFDEVPRDISVTLANEIEILKHWDIEDLTREEDEETVFYAPIDQNESMAWEEGPCEIIVRWTDSNGIVQTARQRDLIEWCADKQILVEEQEE